MKILLSSSAAFFATTAEDVGLMMSVILTQVPPNAVFVTGGCVGPAFHAAKLADRAGHRVEHFTADDWEYDEKGIVGDHTPEWVVSKTMSQRMEIMARSVDLVVVFEGGLGTLEEALIANSRGAKILYFPWISHVHKILDLILTGKGIPRNPSYMPEDEYDNTMKSWVKTVPRIDVFPDPDEPIDDVEKYIIDRLGASREETKTSC